MLRHLAEEGRPAENSTAYSVILRRCREFERRSNSAFSFFFFSPRMAVVIFQRLWRFYFQGGHRSGKEVTGPRSKRRL